MEFGALQKRNGTEKSRRHSVQPFEQLRKREALNFGLFPPAIYSGSFRKANGN